MIFYQLDEADQLRVFEATVPGTPTARIAGDNELLQKAGFAFDPLLENSPELTRLILPVCVGNKCLGVLNKLQYEIYIIAVWSTCGFHDAIRLNMTSPRKLHTIRQMKPGLQTLANQLAITLRNVESAISCNQGAK